MNTTHLKHRILRLVVILSFLLGAAIMAIAWAGDPDDQAVSKFRTITYSLASAVALIGLSLAIWQTYSSVNLSDSLQELTDSSANLNANLQKLAESTSTRYIGVFPDNMDDIIQLIENTRNSLLVVTDAVGYGHFSAPDRFETYWSGIRKLRAEKDVDVKVVVYDDERARLAREEQLGVMANEDFREFQESSELMKYAKWKPIKAERMKENEEAVHEVFSINESEFLASFLEAGIFVHQTDRDIPIFMWISDNQRAIMCMLAKQRKALEYAFETHDAKLIHALEILSSTYLPEERR
jgi:hypothetical protein